MKKVSFTKIPSIGIAHMGMAMMDGARKYGPYNWRSKKVIASIYVDAAIRHWMAWFEGEEVSDDAKVHHLGHAMACGAILLDAQTTGNLIDDRPVVGDSTAAYVAAMLKLSDVIKAKAEEIAAKAAKPKRKR